MKTKLMIAALLACLVPAAALAAPAGHPGRHQHQNQQQQGHRQHQQRGILYVFTGALSAAPSATSFTLTVEGGNRPALKAMLGQSAQQTFAYDSSTEFLLWSHGIPTVVQPSALHVRRAVAPASVLRRLAAPLDRAQLHGDGGPVHRARA